MSTELQACAVKKTVTKGPNPVWISARKKVNQSRLRRLTRDAAGRGDTVQDLGRDAMLLCQAAQRGEWDPGVIFLVGAAHAGRWLAWKPAAPPEPVPGSPGAKAARN